MKKQFFIFLISFFSGFVIFAQSPQSFKYQAVIRDASGAVIQNQNVSLRISLLQGSETGSSVYTEEQSVKTNQFGLVSLNIGEGTSTDNFSEINWGDFNYWIKIELDASGGTDYTDMGTSKLLSVPYSLYSRSKWESTGDTLFCVKDTQGRPVFIVYTDGVQVIVDTTSTKSGASGRFLVSGRGLAKGGKGTELNFMDLTKKNYLIGQDVGQNITTGIRNSVLGYEAGKSLTTGHENTFIGYRAGYNSQTGIENVYIGNFAGETVTGGIGNVNIGYGAGRNHNKDAGVNVYVGYAAGYANASGENNIYIGHQAGSGGNSGINNVYLGSNTGLLNNGNGNVFLGTNVGSTAIPVNISDKLYIDNSNTATPLIWGDFANDSLKVYGSFNINNAYTFPTVDGTSSQVLRTDGNGNLYWGDAVKSSKTSGEIKLLKTLVKKQQKQIDELINKNKLLESRLNAVEKRVNK